MSGAKGQGPLTGIRIVEFAGIGPAPMCAMMLSDLGASVIRIDRTTPSGLGTAKPARFVTNRGRPIIGLDVKAPAGRDAALRMIAKADGLIEGFRPGVMDRLGLGPDVTLKLNPRLVYGHVTGWGQDGPLASVAGHDLNYLALSGALHAIGRKDQPPTPPLALLGDFAGGALYLALGMLAALFEARDSGKGQVVDAAILDGVLSLMTSFYGMLAVGSYNEERGTNLLDSGDPFYDVYACRDGKYVSIAPIETKFREELCRRIGYAYRSAAEFRPVAPAERDEARRRLSEIFASKTRADWCDLLEGTDACFAPVLSMSEAPSHPQNRARNSFYAVDGVVQPGPAPRFGRSVIRSPSRPDIIGERSHQVLQEWGFDAEEIRVLQKSRILL